MELRNLSELWPDFHWEDYVAHMMDLVKIDTKTTEMVIVRTPDYFSNLTELYNSTEHRWRQCMCACVRVSVEDYACVHNYTYAHMCGGMSVHVCMRGIVLVHVYTYMLKLIQTLELVKFDLSV